MKKALAILLALSMVFAAFADAPATNYSVAEFKGEAEFGWKTDLDKEENGFFNSESANLKINLLNGGDATTAGDGIWGELKIKIDTPDALTNPGDLSIGKTASVETAKIHFIDGDYGITLNLKAPSLALGEVVLPTATGKDKDNDAWKSDKFDVTSYGPKVNGVKIDQLQAELSDLKGAYNDAVHQAKLDGKEKPYETVDVLTAKARVDAKEKELANAKATPEALTAGFAVEFTSDIIDANLKVLDNGVAKEKEYGFAADATVKAVENMNVKAGFAYAYEKSAFVASADYKYAIDDTMYVKPGLAYGMMDETKELAVSALFGWGADGQSPDFIKYDDDNRYIANKCADGFSVTYTTNLDEVDSIMFGLYDSTLVEGLKVGAEYFATLDDFAEGSVVFAAKYNKDIDILTIGLDFGMTSDLGTKDSASGKYAVQLSTDDVIDNTNVYAKYENGFDASADKGTKGTVTLGAKIAF